MAQTFSDLGRIEAVRQLFEGTPWRPFEEPLWFTAKPQECITTASGLLLEGIDFDLVYFPLKHLGRKAVLKVTGELYAVLAQPETLSVQLGVSAKLDFPQVQERPRRSTATSTSAWTCSPRATASPWHFRPPAATAPPFRPPAPWRRART